MCGGGGSGNTTSTVTNTNLPAYAEPYVKQLFGQASSLTNINQNPYQVYQGDRVAGFSPLQQQGFQNISMLQPATQLDQASGLASLAGAQNFDQSQADKYMSPYMKDVVENQQQGAIRDWARSIPQMGATAARAGGLGGTRQALVQSEANRGLQDQLGGIRATGLQNAFQNAQQQFNTDRQNRMNASGILGNLGAEQYRQQTGLASGQLQAGAQQQAQQQKVYDTMYGDFLNQQQWPYKNLGFYSDILHGLTTGQNSSSTVYGPQPNTAGQLAGLGIGLGSLFSGLGGG